MLPNQELFDYYVKRSQKLEKCIRWVLAYEQLYTSLLDSLDENEVDFEYLERISERSLAAQERMYLTATGQL